jgi:subfamily B ATP-binding cassette protein MsbA
MSGIQLYFRLLQYVKPYWGVFALSILGMLILAATEVALPSLRRTFQWGAFG